MPRNIAGVFGAALFVASVVSLAFLLLVEVMQGHADPYIGLFTYMVLPITAVIGVLLFAFGRWLRNRANARGEEATSITFLDLSHIESRQSILIITGLVAGGGVFLMSATGVRAIEYTESESFCGDVCHAVMSPEYTAYQHAPHANIACVECHVGEGAGSFIRAKVRGMKQVWSVATDSYPRPIPTPIHMGTAEEICQACHWPDRDIGNKPVSRRYYLTEGFDEPWGIEMSVKVGGGTYEDGFTEGAHWHMNLDSKVEYIAADAQRQEIAMVRWTDHQGNEVEFLNLDMEEPEQYIEGGELHEVDCLTCHNRPAHELLPPVELLNRQFANGSLDPQMPGIRWLALELLAADYESTEEAHAAIATGLLEGVEDEDPDYFADNIAQVDATVLALQNLFGRSRFPAMNADWRVYPDNMKHWSSPGCYRCHSGNMVSEDGLEISWSCTTCHTILGQGRVGNGSWAYDPNGLDFIHPSDEEVMEGPVLCHDCHDGSLGY